MRPATLRRGGGRTALPACWMGKMLSCSPAEMKMGGCPWELSAQDAAGAVRHHLPEQLPVDHACTAAESL